MTQLVPVVSVVLPTFNRLEYLRPAIESVFAQSYGGWELIVADDGSDAATLAYLETLANLSRVRLLKLPHSGNPGKVRNAALRVARGKYIAFLDSDDLWSPRKLESQLKVHQANPTRRWSYTTLTRVDAAGTVLSGESEKRRVVQGGSIIEQLLTLRIAIATPSVMAERSLIEEVGGFDEEQLYFEEYDLWLRLNLSSEVSAIDQPFALVRTHEKHYSADRVGVYLARFRLLDKFAIQTVTPHLSAVIRAEQAKTAAALSSVYAASGMGIDALKMLWRSRHRAWHSGEWWHRAGGTVGRAVAPGWLRSVARRMRAGGQPLAPAPVAKTRGRIES